MAHGSNNGLAIVVLTPSTMLELGTRAPDFTLPDAYGNPVALAEFVGAPATVVVFMCNHCPYVKHLKTALAEFAHEYATREVAVIGIDANDAETHPEDGREAMIRDISEFGYAFPYLIDNTQEVAKAYRAACTPDFFVFDAELRLVYRGQFDDKPPQERHAGDRQRPPCGGGHRPGRPGADRRARAEHRLQHQVEAGQRARLLPVVDRPAPQGNPNVLD